MTPVSKTTRLEASTTTFTLAIVPIVAVTPEILPEATRVFIELE